MLNYKMALAQLLAKKQGGGASPEEKDINFFDYDGTLLHSCTLEEARALTALPTLPKHPGLVCQGWNWTLAEVRAVDRPAIIGPNYDTPDGCTRLHIDTVVDGLVVTLQNYQDSADDHVIDWGDGSDPETSGTSGSYTLSHAYATGGKFVVSISAASGSMTFGNNSAAILNKDVVVEINVGHQTRGMSASCCIGLRRLQKVSFPHRVGGVSLSASSIFQSTESLGFLSLPRESKTSGTYFCRFSAGLLGVSAPPNFTHGVAAFCDATELRFMPIPDGQEEASSLFCRSARCAPRVDFSAALTNIAANAFANCESVLLYDFTRHTSVPTLANTNAFTGIDADCVIRVPVALRDEWAAATNWATYADYIVGV